MSTQNDNSTTNDRNHIEIGGELVSLSAEQRIGGRMKREVTLRCKFDDGRPSYPKLAVFDEDAKKLGSLPKNSKVCLTAQVRTYTGTNRRTGRPYKGTTIEAREINSVESVSIAGGKAASNVLEVGGQIMAISDELSTRGAARRDIVLQSLSEGGSNSPKLSVFDGQLASQLVEIGEGQRVCLKGSVRTYTGENPKTGRLYTGMSLDVKEIIPAADTDAKDSPPAAQAGGGALRNLLHRS